MKNKLLSILALLIMVYAVDSYVTRNTAQEVAVEDLSNIEVLSGHARFSVIK